MPLSDDKHNKLKKHTGNPRQRLRQFFLTFFFFDNFFLAKIFFLRFFLGLNFVFDWIWSRTEFCLGLHAAVVFRVQSFNFAII